MPELLFADDRTASSHASRPVKAHEAGTGSGSGMCRHSPARTRQEAGPYGSFVAPSPTHMYFCSVGHGPRCSKALPFGCAGSVWTSALTLGGLISLKAPWAGPLQCRHPSMRNFLAKTWAFHRFWIVPVMGEAQPCQQSYCTILLAARLGLSRLLSLPNGQVMGRSMWDFIARRATPAGLWASCGWT